MRLFIIFVLIALGGHGFGQDNSINIPCNSHQLGEFTTAMDTTAAYINFHIVDSMNNPIPNIKITVLGDYAQLNGKNKGINLILSTDENGTCSTKLIHASNPLSILIGDNREPLYEFEFKKS